MQSMQVRKDVTGIDLLGHSQVFPKDFI